MGRWALGPSGCDSATLKLVADCAQEGADRRLWIVLRTCESQLQALEYSYNAPLRLFSTARATHVAYSGLKLVEAHASTRVLWVVASGVMCSFRLSPLNVARSFVFQPFTRRTCRVAVTPEAPVPLLPARSALP